MCYVPLWFLGLVGLCVCADFLGLVGFVALVGSVLFVAGYVSLGCCLLLRGGLGDLAVLVFGDC